jgi:hypothetical protein
MKDHSFVYNNVAITFLDGYLDINNCSIEHLISNITISDILICTLCVVQLESAYVFRELCRQAAIICRSKYSASQIIKFEHVDEVDNNSQNNISPVLLFENVEMENEQVCDKNDEYLSNFGSKNNTHPKIQILEAEKFSCSNCVNIYSSKCALRRHIRIVHLKIHFSCKVCPSVYSSKKDLLAHIQSDHENNSFVCKACGQKFNNPDDLSYHKKSVHLGFLHKCNVCRKVFKAQSTLFTHNRSQHLGILYKCEKCPKKFKQSHSLKLHKEDVHLNKKYTCGICLKLFNRYLALKLHINRDHLNNVY